MAVGNFPSELGLSECPNDISGCIKFRNLCFKNLSSGNPPSIYTRVLVMYPIANRGEKGLDSPYDPIRALDLDLARGRAIL